MRNSKLVKCEALLLMDYKFFNREPLLRAFLFVRSRIPNVIHNQSVMLKWVSGNYTFAEPLKLFVPV
jgi:hypothetical protein